MSSSFKKLIPTLNRVLVKKVEQELKSKAGIILQSAQDKNSVGEIVATGPGVYDNNGKLVETQVKVGQVVLLPEFGGQTVKLADGEFHIYRDSDIIGVLNE